MGNSDSKEGEEGTKDMLPADQIDPNDVKVVKIQRSRSKESDEDNSAIDEKEIPDSNCDRNLNEEIETTKDIPNGAKESFKPKSLKDVKGGSTKDILETPEDKSVRPKEARRSEENVGNVKTQIKGDRAVNNAAKSYPNRSKFVENERIRSISTYQEDNGEFGAGFDDIYRDNALVETESLELESIELENLKSLEWEPKTYNPYHLLSFDSEDDHVDYYGPNLHRKKPKAKRDTCNDVKMEQTKANNSVNIKSLKGCAILEPKGLDLDDDDNRQQTKGNNSVNTKSLKGCAILEPEVLDFDEDEVFFENAEAEGRDEIGEPVFSLENLLKQDLDTVWECTEEEEEEMEMLKVQDRIRRFEENQRSKGKWETSKETYHVSPRRKP